MLLKKGLFFFLCIILLFSIGIPLLAQPIEPPPEPIPIDGGIGFLLIAGAAYGITKLAGRRKK